MNENRVLYLQPEKNIGEDACNVLDFEYVEESHIINHLPINPRQELISLLPVLSKESNAFECVILLTGGDIVDLK